MRGVKDTAHRALVRVSKSMWLQCRDPCDLKQHHSNYQSLLFMPQRQCKDKHLNVDGGGSAQTTTIMDRLHYSKKKLKKVDENIYMLHKTNY